MRIAWRVGDGVDPYVDKTDTQMIVNNVIILTEIPDEFAHVIVSGHIEIYDDEPEAGEFRVDYQTGIVTFNSIENGKTVTANYKGKGYILYPASRIYAWNKNDTNVEQNLQDIIDSGQFAIDVINRFQEFIDKFNQKVEESTVATDRANASAVNADIKAGYAHEQGDYAKAQGDYAMDQGNFSKEEGANARVQADNALVQANFSKLQADNALVQANYAEAQGNYAREKGDYALERGNDLHNRGEFDPAIEYQVNNFVQYKGSTYICIADSIGNLPTEELFWNLIVLKAQVDSVNGKIGEVVIDWEDLKSRPTSKVIDIDDAVEKRHVQNTDTGTDSASFTLSKRKAGNASIFVKDDTYAGIRWNEANKRWEFVSDSTTWSKLFAQGYFRSDGVEVSYSDHKHDWLDIVSGIPTTIAGYGITDAYTKSEISDFLEQKLNLSGGTMEGFLTLNDDPINPLHAVTKQYVDEVRSYVDAVKQSLDTKESVRVATDGNITLSGIQTVDGVILTEGDRVLVKSQTNAVENGIYIVDAETWSRSTDADSDDKVTSGLYVWVTEGSSASDSGWILSTPDPITLGTTELTFTQFSGAGQIEAGVYLVKTGNSIAHRKSGAKAGTYTKVTVDQYGHITSASTPSTLTELGVSLSEPDIPSLDWSKIVTGKPTTLGGYGITDATPSSHIGSGGDAHDLADGTNHGFMNTADFNKLAGISEGANKVTKSSTNGYVLVDGENMEVYIHPTTDGSKHVPATGTTNNNKVLKAGATAGSLTWGTVVFDEVTGAITDIQHGIRGGGALHSVANETSHGFMSKEEHAKLKVIESEATATPYPIVNATEPVDVVSGQVWYNPSTLETKIYLDGSFKHAGANPPVISEDEPVSGVTEGLIWFNPKTNITKVYIGGSFLDIGGSGSGGGLLPSLVTVKLTEDADRFEHGITFFMKDRDIIHVYKNSTYLHYGDDYIVSSDDKQIISTSGNWSKDSVFQVEVIASVPAKSSLVTTRNEMIYTALEDGESTVLIDMSAFDHTQDLMDVLLVEENLPLIRDVNYRLMEDGKSIELLGFSLSKGKRLLFQVYKQIRIKDEISLEVNDKIQDLDTLMWMGV